MAINTKTHCPHCEGKALIITREYKYWLICFECGYSDFLSQAGKIYRNKIAMAQRLKEKNEIKN